MSVHLLFQVLINLPDSTIPTNNLQTYKSLVSYYEVLEYIFLP